MKYNSQQQLECQRGEVRVRGGCVRMGGAWVDVCVGWGESQFFLIFSGGIDGQVSSLDFAHLPTAFLSSRCS